jgi:hypothetical protein
MTIIRLADFPIMQLDANLRAQKADDKRWWEVMRVRLEAGAAKHFWHLNWLKVNRPAEYAKLSA